MPRQMVAPRLTEISGVDHPAHLLEGWLVQKAKRTGRTTVPKLSKEALAALPEDAQAYIKSLKKVAKESKVTPGFEEPTDAETFEKAIADLPAPAREAFLKQQREAAESRSVAKALWDEREAGRFETMAKELAHLPRVGKDGSFAKSLQKAATSAGEAFDPIFEVLKAADAVIKESAFFGEIGSSHTSVSGSAEESIIAKATELMHADPALTLPEAVEKAATQNPELYRTQRSESLKRNQSVEA